MDSEGIIHEFLLKNNIIHLNWCVDDPFYEEIIHLKKFRSSSCRIDFVSDRDYVETMISEGYNAHFLPLATDPSLFFPDSSKIIHDLCFVGNSYLYQVDEFTSLAPNLIESMLPFIASVLKEYLSHNDIDIEKKLYQKISTCILPENCSARKALFICKHLAGYLYRKEVVLKLAQSFQSFAVYGDAGWEPYLNNILHNTISYGNELRTIYNGTKINIDINRVVIRNGFTQRIFDALACRSFLITSEKPVIHEFFKTEGEKEIVTFSNTDELTDVVRYYLQHESERISITQRGHARVLAAHTYLHRIQQLFSIVKKQL